MYVCNILSPKNAFGSNKTVYQYGSRQKEVVVWFEAGQRSAGMPHRPIPYHFEHWMTLIIMMMMMSIMYYAWKKDNNKLKLKR